MKREEECPSRKSIEGGAVLKKVIAYDLGTGGVKASLHDASGHMLSKVFIEYRTFYPRDNWHEQRPEDWMDAVIKATEILLREGGCPPGDIACLALSGHSLVAVPVDREGALLSERVPIWSDGRADEQTQAYFAKVDPVKWYLKTGNGFPARCYSIFKLMWLKEHQPEVYQNLYKVLGSKDYVNFRLCGRLAMDYSYASGTGAFDLKNRRMDGELLAATGLRPDIFPELLESHAVLGRLTPEAAALLRLSEETLVACGGVDNACMALGAVGAGEGEVYTSLGSSSWIAVNSREPILDAGKRPYVFAHIEEGLYTSAFSIFAGGGSLHWLRDTLCQDLGGDAYRKMDEIASRVPIGSNGVLFNPSLAGGTSQDRSVHIRGAFAGLSLGSTRADMIRAVMEGVAMNLRLSLDSLKEHAALSDEMLFCGGGSKSEFWMRMFADVFEMTIRKTNIDQEAASLGAAAIALRASGLWRDYGGIKGLHQTELLLKPDREDAARYRVLMGKFRLLNDMAAELGEAIHNNF